MTLSDKEIDEIADGMRQMLKTAVKERRQITFKGWRGIEEDGVTPSGFVQYKASGEKSFTLSIGPAGSAEV